MSGIARICFPFVGDSVGGSHISTLALIRRLDPARFFPVVVVHQEGPLTRHLREQSIGYILLPLSGFAGASPNLVAIAWNAFRAAFTLVPFIRKSSIALVHANDLRMNLTWFLAAKLAGRPFIWHQRITPMSRSRIWRLLPLLADRVIAISEAVADAFKRGSWRPEVIYNPFEVPDRVPDKQVACDSLRLKLGLSKDTLVIGFVGRLVPHKRADICIRMLPEVQQRVGRSVVCLIIGRGKPETEESLREISRKFGVAESVRFLGFQYPVDDYITGLDLLVAPSEIEGFGRTLVESMLVGTPVIASRVGSHLEIIEDGRTGCLVDVGDVAGFAAAAARLLSDNRLRHQIAETSRSEVASRFSAATHVEKISAIYERLLRQ